MKSIVTEENGIEIIYLFAVKELEQTLAQDVGQKKPLLVRKNNFIHNRYSYSIYLKFSYGTNN